MKVFVTGATGFIGSAIVRELLAAGHQVIGLARSEASAASLTAIGVKVQHGTLDDLDSLRSGAAAADGVIHTGYKHDFSAIANAAETDQRAIETLGNTLIESNRPLVIASGIALLTPGRFGTEDDAPDPHAPAAARIRSEEIALALAERGVRTSIVRLPPTVHGEGDHGFVPALIAAARARGVAAYPGDGTNRWSAVHRLDAAHLFRLALESAPAGSHLHGVADEGIPVRAIASMIGQHLNIPVNAVPVNEIGEYLGWLGSFFTIDCVASSTLTQQRLGWHPVQPSLLTDLDHDYYFENA